MANKLPFIHQLDIQNNSLSSSLSDGIVKRLYKLAIDNEQNLLKDYPHYFAGDDFVSIFEREAPYLKNLSKSIAMLRLMTICGKGLTYSANPAAPKEKNTKKATKNNAAKNAPSRFHGFLIREHGFVKIEACLNRKKPHQSYLCSFPIALSQHAVSRLIYRFKAQETFDTLSRVIKICYMALANDDKDMPPLPQEDEGYRWVIIQGIGAFLFASAESIVNGHVMVTFVDEEKLSVQQRHSAKLYQDYIEKRVAANCPRASITEFERKAIMDQKGSEKMVLNIPNLRQIKANVRLTKKPTNASAY